MTLPELDTTHLMALAAALGWASGLRLYAVVFITGLVGLMGWVPLPEGLKVLQHPAVLGVSGFMLAVEFLADKIPGIDSLWDVIHTVLRVPAGAALAASVFGADNSTMAIVAALMGGTLAATAHTAKATTCAAVNTSPEPFSNLAVSLAEDGIVPAGLWLALVSPMVFFVALAAGVVAMVVTIWVLWKYLRRILQRLRTLFGTADAPV